MTFYLISYCKTLCAGPPIYQTFCEKSGNFVTADLKWPLINKQKFRIMLSVMNDIVNSIVIIL